MSRRPTIKEIENAFQPAREITSPDRFAGRKQSVLDGYYGLISEGSNIAIIGNRGIGKTSLARQLINIASGDNELLKRLDIPVDEPLDYLPIFFACDDSIKNYVVLLSRLITLRTALAEWVYYIPKAQKEVESLSPAVKGTLGIPKVASVEGSVGAEVVSESFLESPISQHEIEEIFINVVNAIAEENIAENGILIVIDEFDRIKDPSGFASFLKALATNVPRVKFVIVGVAQDIQNLMNQHESADRLFAGSIIELPPMSESELLEIVDIAEQEIHNYITFEKEAKEFLVALAQGHPYMVHLIGKYALRLAHQNSKRTIAVPTIEGALEMIAKAGADPILEGRYKNAVRSSPQREIVLKALAESQKKNGEIWTGEAYKLAIDRGVDNASQYVGQLVTEEYGAEIVKVRDRYYRFRDSLFATYVRIRPSLFDK